MDQLLPWGAESPTSPSPLAAFKGIKSPAPLNTGEQDPAAGSATSINN